MSIIYIAIHFLMTFENISAEKLPDSTPINISNQAVFIDKLTDKEFMIIAFSESGCFTKKKEFRRLKVERRGMHFYVSSNGTVKKMSESQVAMIRNFETQLDSVSKMSICTKSGHYLLRYKKNTKNVLDNTCSWHGYDMLIKELLKE